MGRKTRDFSYVSDTARGIILAGLSADSVGMTINLGSGTEVTINELVRLVAEVVGNPSAVIQYDDPRPGDVYRLLADVTEAKEVLGYSPKIGLKEGLGRLQDWYLRGKKTPDELLENDVVRNWEPVAP